MSVYNSIHEVIKYSAITTFFQPIVHARKQCVLGYEALSRGPLLSGLRSPATLSKSAELYDAQTELELICIKSALNNFKSKDANRLLFLNVSYETLNCYKVFEAVIIAAITKSRINPHRVVFELTEHGPSQNIGQLKQAIRKLRCFGFSIALDDLGAGYSSLQLWSELSPDYIKFDRHFIHNIENDSVKQQFVRSLYQLAHSQGCQAIAEGVETFSEAQWLADTQVNLMQGFYFARPRRNPLDLNPSRFPKYRRRAQVVSNIIQNPRPEPQTLFSQK